MRDLVFVVLFESSFDRETVWIIAPSDNVEQVPLETGQVMDEGYYL
ncbi:hypothetical protein HAPAU_36710 [Halalkalicoccus paucihalophilus]|uniref:Uncharacterized protein n=1 Tax=Halalkalicoccus paucihalophilus TaxID=1008153 RepID=A0A151A9G8_9EURY|nr:hypothetical protein HAPAU_36710 [Halalkalicoccus paucihalophilus]